MKCQNCGENEANVMYTQIVNGVKKEMYLCEECSKKLGIGHNIEFNMPIDLSSFLGNFLEEYDDGFMDSFNSFKNELKCSDCGMTFSEFINSGNLGCANCYDVFSNKLDNVLKNIHGLNRHVGRRGKIALKDGLKLKIENKKSELKENAKEKQEINVLK